MTITIHAQDDGADGQGRAVITDEATVLNGNVFLNNGSGADSDPTAAALDGDWR